MELRFVDEAVDFSSARGIAESCRGDSSTAGELSSKDFR